MDEEVYRRNLGLGNKVEVLTPEGIKEIELQPLSIEYLPDILFVQSALGEAEGDEKKISKVLADEEVAKRMAKLVNETLRESITDKDEKYINFVAMKNFLLLITEIFKVNDLGVSGLDAVKERLNRLKQVREGGKSTNPS